MLNYPIDDESAEEVVAQQSGNIGESELAVIDSAILSPDEQDNCPAGYFHCNTTAQCVPQRANCDGSVDCDDTSDEWNCVNDVDAKYWDHLFRKNPYGRQGMDDKPIGECSEYAKRRRRREVKAIRAPRGAGTSASRPIEVMSFGITMRVLYVNFAGRYER